MHLVEDAEQEQGREKPALAPLDDAPEERKHEENHERWHQVGLPDEACISEWSSSGGVEQRCNDTCKPSVIAAREEIGEHCCCSRKCPYQHCSPERIGAECG